MCAACRADRDAGAAVLAEEHSDHVDVVLTVVVDEGHGTRGPSAMFGPTPGIAAG